MKSYEADHSALLLVLPVQAGIDGMAREGNQSLLIKVVSKQKDAVGEKRSHQATMCRLDKRPSQVCLVLSSLAGSGNIGESCGQTWRILCLNERCGVSTALLIVYQFDGLTMER